MTALQRAQSRDRHSFTVTEAARFARDEDPGQDDRPTYAELRLEEEGAPREPAHKRCACGNPLQRSGGWTYMTCEACAS